ncbi:uncharacterized protein LOC113009291 [Astatotilapia calliptera]|uniref:uncharacterized protein LOC113009291 n=1 Tax=Astatotilapia calliptera TaxID=8154 RepID=UPI000E400DED|nr:uncharacterized protein LOC113009291 [Astatotilapia calliptera]
MPDYDHDMDPATHNPSAELREDLIYTVEYHCQEWEALPGDEHREVVAVRLQRMVSGLPWLFGALRPHIRDFLVSTVGVRPELPLQCEGSEDVQPGPLEDSRPGSSPSPSRRKRRSRRRRASTAERAAPVGESDCASHTPPKFSEPELHDLCTTVSGSVFPAVVLPDSDNSVTFCLDSRDTIQRGTSVSDHSPVALASNLCVFEPSIFFDLADMNVSPVEIAEPKTVIPHQTLLHSATSIVAPQNCFTQPLDSEVSQSELSHTPSVSSALDVTVHAEKHMPPETVCSIANAPPSDCFMFQPILSLDIPDISQPTPQPAIALSAPQRVTENETCVAEQADLTSAPSVLPEPGDRDYYPFLCCEQFNLQTSSCICDSQCCSISFSGCGFFCATT